MPSLKQQISQSLLEDRFDANLKRWASYIIDNEIDFMSLVELAEGEKTVATRFIWMVGGLCEQKPELVYPAVTWFFARREELPILNFGRSLPKMMWLCGIPEEIEGEAADLMFQWVMDPDIIVSTKAYAISALFNLTKKYPELKEELKLVIEDQLNKNTIAFKTRGLNILKKLEKSGM